MSELTGMIEESDNDDATALWNASDGSLGPRTALVHADGVFAAAEVGRTKVSTNFGGVATYVLLPNAGVRESELYAVGANLVAGVVALALSRGSRPAAATLSRIAATDFLRTAFDGVAMKTHSACSPAKRRPRAEAPAW